VYLLHSPHSLTQPPANLLHLCHSLTRDRQVASVLAALTSLSHSATCQLAALPCTYLPLGLLTCTTHDTLPHLPPSLALLSHSMSHLHAEWPLAHSKLQVSSIPPGAAGCGHIAPGHSQQHPHIRVDGGAAPRFKCTGRLTPELKEYLASLVTAYNMRTQRCVEVGAVRLPGGCPHP
jgi:hypothetical protein